MVCCTIVSELPIFSSASVVVAKEHTRCSTTVVNLNTSILSIVNSVTVKSDDVISEVDRLCVDGSSCTCNTKVTCDRYRTGCVTDCNTREVT